MILSSVNPLLFAASANPIIYLGGIPVFVDSEKDTWNLCPNAVEEAIKGLYRKGKNQKPLLRFAFTECRIK